MKEKSRRAIRAMIVLYLVVSGICFDGVRTERFLCLSFSNETAESRPILTDMFGSAREDACTAEMLGSAQNVFICQQEAPKRGGLQRKQETLRQIFLTMASCLVPCSSYVFVRISNLRCAGNLTQIIHFIHSKDGKK